MKKTKKNSKIGVSIIVPVYNGEKYINNCLKMLLVQEGEYEIVVINDGSTDGTDALIKEYLSDSRIRYYKGPNEGVSVARNRGLQLSKNEWVIFCDVDDEIGPGYILDAMDVISKYNTVDYICYGRYHLGNKDRTEFLISSPNTNINMIIAGRGIEQSSDYFMRGVWSKVFNKEFLLNNKISFNPKLPFAEDALFMLTAAISAQQVLYIHRGYYRYVQNDDSVCHTVGSENDYKGYLTFVEETEKIRTKTFDIWEKSNMQEEYKYYMIQYGMLAMGRIRSGTRNLDLKQRRKMIRRVSSIIEKYKCQSLDSKNKIKRNIIKWFPTLYIIWGDTR